MYNRFRVCRFAVLPSSRSDIILLSSYFQDMTALAERQEARDCNMHLPTTQKRSDSHFEDVFNKEETANRKAKS